MLRNGESKIEPFSSQKPAQLPSTNLFSIFSSQGSGKSKPEKVCEEEEIQFFQSEPDEPSEDYVEGFLQKLGKIDKENENQRRQILQRKKSLRLEDQQIIEVEEQINPNANFEQGDSVILEHIDFNADNRAVEDASQWKPQFLCTSNYDQNQKYVINFITPQTEEMNEHKTLSNQNFHDFEMQDLKLKRNSASQKGNKNQHQEAITKSCFDRPQDDEEKGQSKKNIDHILRHKSGGLSPDYKYQEFQSNPTVKSGQKINVLRYNSGKNLFGQNRQHQQQFNNSEIISKKQFKVLTVDNHAQTQIRGYYLQMETKNLSQELQVSIAKLSKSEDQNCKLKQQSEHYIAYINQLRSNIESYQQEISCLKSNNRNTTQTEDLEGNAKKNLKANRYQKQQSISSFSPIFVSNLSFKSDDLRSTLNFSNFDKQKHQNHSLCIKKIQQLQQYIFDIEQKISGIEIEVEQKVKSIETSIIQNTIAECQQKSEMIVNNLKEEMAKLQKLFYESEQKRKDINQEYMSVKKLLMEKEKQIQNLNKELNQKNTEIQFLKIQEYNPDIQISYAPPISPKSSQFAHRPSINISEICHMKAYKGQSNYLSSIQIKSPKASTVRHVESRKSAQYLRPQENLHRLDRKNITNLNKHKMSTSTFYNNCYTEPRRISPFRQTKSREITPIRHRLLTKNHEFKEVNQLMSINSKIQRLRQQISKELDSIH